MASRIPISLASDSINALVEAGPGLVTGCGATCGVAAFALAAHSTLARRERNRLENLEADLTALITAVTPDPARPVTKDDLGRALGFKSAHETARKKHKKLRDLLDDVCQALDAAERLAGAGLAPRNGRERDQHQQQLGACASAIRTAAHAARQRVRVLRSR